MRPARLTPVSDEYNYYPHFFPPPPDALADAAPFVAAVEPTRFSKSALVLTSVVELLFAAAFAFFTSLYALSVSIAVAYRTGSFRRANKKSCNDAVERRHGKVYGAVQGAEKESGGHCYASEES